MNVYLIGYRGSGKSTVAPLVARKIGWQTVDSDDLIETTAKKTIVEIFRDDGEPRFRELETQVIKQLSQDSQRVVSLGGGAVMRESNRALIAKSGKSVWLDAAADILWNRISGDGTTAQRRPNLTAQGGMREVEQILAARNPVYNECADLSINVNELSPQQIAEKIVRWLKKDDTESGNGF